MKDEFVSVDVMYSETSALLRVRHNGFDLELTPEEALGLSELLVACVAMVTHGDSDIPSKLH